MTILGIIIIAIVILITIITAILETKDAISVGSAYFMGIVAGCLIILGFLLILEDPIKEKEQTEFKYPTTEYTLEYEVLTRGKQVDSTYVISKIE